MITSWIDPAELKTRYPEVQFGLGVTVGEDVKIGKHSKIASGVCIYPRTRLGEEVTVLENTVLGRPTITPENSGVKRTLGDDVGPLIIGNRTVIGCQVVLYRGTTLGEACIICDLTSIREHCQIGDAVLLGRSVMVQVNTRIGNRTKIMDSCHLPGDMLVGEDVFMSTHVCGASENSLGRSDMTGKWSGPTLRDRCYIGLNATLLPGIEVGEDAVVAGGSVVTKSVPPATLVMGAPARVIRSIAPNK